MCTIRRVRRYQRGNQNPYIEEEETTQWPKVKVQKDKQRSTKHTYKSKDRVTRTPLITGGELRCSGRVSRNPFYIEMIKKYRYICHDRDRNNKTNTSLTHINICPNVCINVIFEIKIPPFNQLRVDILLTRKNTFMTASFHQEGRFGPIYKTSLITPLVIEMPVPSQECKRHVFYVSTIIGLDFKIVPTLWYFFFSFYQ